MAVDVITIDGPAASGKTTSAAGVARALGFAYVDSGALYRAAALAVARRYGETDGASLDDDEVEAVLAGAEIQGVVGGGGFRVTLDGDDVSDEIRTPVVSRLSSVYATRPGVRRKVTGILRELAESSEVPVVVEGRDIGTVVFPGASLKVFMVADLEERARRRWKDLAAKGLDPDPADVEKELAERDARDSGRDVAPLAAHPDALRIDTTRLSVAEQIRRIVEAYRLRRESAE